VGELGGVAGRRNNVMAGRIERAAVSDPLRFAVAGDSGAWADPTADAIFGALVRQIAEIDPAPVFFANLGDFAGPGTIERHEHYLRLVEPLAIPNVCVVGNHDLDDPSGPDAWQRVHGPMNFTFAHGHTRFVAIHGEPGIVGDIVVPSPPEGTQGPREEDLAFLERTLAAAPEPHRIVLTHQPPYLDGHYEPHADWGFKQREDEFLEILRAQRVKLVCCAHGLAFDHHVHDGIHFVMSGGGGTGVCSEWRGVCTEGADHPEDRGALFHAVEITISESGAVSGRVLQAFDGPKSARIRFGDV
jgi:hypothetical protein